jgi:hypothetical protein
LIGFADEKTGNIRLASPFSTDTFDIYILTFEMDGLLDGTTSTNRASGKYVFGENSTSNLQIPFFGPITYINELFDGRPYIEAMKKVNSYKISSKGLSLNYDDGKFLLFKPLE